MLNLLWPRSSHERRRGFVEYGSADRRRLFSPAINKASDGFAHETTNCIVPKQVQGNLASRRTFQIADIFKLESGNLRNDRLKTNRLNRNIHGTSEPAGFVGKFDLGT